MWGPAKQRWLWKHPLRNGGYCFFHGWVGSHRKMGWLWRGDGALASSGCLLLWLQCISLLCPSWDTAPLASIPWNMVCCNSESKSIPPLLTTPTCVRQSQTPPNPQTKAWLLLQDDYSRVNQKRPFPNSVITFWSRAGDGKCAKALCWNHQF